jgi:hypothetical protein
MSQKSTFCFVILLFFYNNVFAESTYGNYNSAGSSVRGQVARIMMSGLGGAVFGVSTLSFYGEPQKHLSNVAIGAALGLLVGSIYVTSVSLNEDTNYSYKPNFEFQFEEDRLALLKRFELSKSIPPIVSWEIHF